MYNNILNERQNELLPFLNKFKRTYFLVGGTSIALYIGHRRSVDFGLFTYGKINKQRIKAALLEVPFKKTILFEDVDQLHFIINEVQYILG
ncbi:MAG: hypothetical protein WCX31_02630 [Salinivirgaceae bacterium]|jgi:hypothetical protein